jgi:CubicO group peptidase (beta-lactamase class C family)
VRHGLCLIDLAFQQNAPLCESFEDLLSREILEPLGMADTGFWVPPEKRCRWVVNTTSPTAGEFESAPIGSYTLPQPARYASGGQGLVSTAADYLAFASMLVRGGEADGGRLLKAETVQLMITNRLTALQRQGLFMGMPLFASRGFGLGGYVVTDAPAQSVMGAGEVGAYGWPGAFGGFWQADPARQAVLIWLQDCLPPPPRQGVLPRMPGMAGVTAFQKAAYQAFT